jgi:hypothetical protein
MAASLWSRAMSDAVAKPATAFDGERSLASGPLIDVAMAVKAATAAGAEGPAARLRRRDRRGDRPRSARLAR